MSIEKCIVTYDSWKIYVEKHISDPAHETIIMVNGALSTTAAFKNTVKNLSGRFNIILFDLPFIGESLPHNTLDRVITKNDEVSILLYLIDTFEPDHILSISWGGLSSMLALSNKPKQIKKAVIASFSAHLNDKMRDYIQRARHYIHSKEFENAAELLNNEVGKFLPPLLKHINLKHISSMSEFAFQQVNFHIDQVLTLKEEQYIEIFKDINAEVLFLNGENDEYTTADDIKKMEKYIRICEFSTIPEAGHFLDLENRKAAKQVAERIITFFA